MELNVFFRSTTFLLMLLNPFLMILYVMDLVQEYDRREFARVLSRAGLISFLIFAAFGIFGEAVFTDVIQAQFASFQIFGGIVFLLIGVRFVFLGNEAFRSLRGDPRQIAGSIAMPIMIGPATVSASVMAGERLGIGLGALSIFLAVFSSVAVMIVLKVVHDLVKPRHEKMVERYVEIMGRITALLVGTFAIEMIMQGLRFWLDRLLG